MKNLVKNKMKKISLLVLTVMLLGGITFSIIQVVFAADKPNPGHSWSELECGTNLCISTSTGLVGIGTITPNSKLQVDGRVDSSRDSLSTKSNSGTYSALYAEQSNSSGYAGYFSGKVGITTNLTVGSLSNCLHLKASATGLLECDNVGYLTEELDPKVGTITNDKWCTSDGTKVNCTSDAPVGGVTSVKNHTGDSTLNIFPTEGEVRASINLDNSNTWTGVTTMNNELNHSAENPFFINSNNGLQLRINANGGTDIFKINNSSNNPIFSVDNNGNTIIGSNGTGKLTVGIIDPVFDIGGNKYSTYVPSMTGVKEETVGVVNPIEGKYIIDFNNLKEGSDFWLFYRVTDFGENWDKLVVFVSGEGSGKVWYRKNLLENQLVFYSENSIPISYRLTAPRFDWQSWLNVSKDGSVQGLAVGEVVNNQYVKNIEINSQSLDIFSQVEKDLFEEFTQKVKQSLAYLGISFENEIIKLRELVVNMVRTDDIEIKGKIQLQDQTTGDIYCTWIDRGEWVKIKGRCDNVSASVDNK